MKKQPNTVGLTRMKASVEDEIKKALEIGWFAPSIPVKKFSELLEAKRLEKENQEREQEQERMSFLDVLCSLKKRTAEKAIVSFDVKRNWVYASAALLLGDWVFARHELGSFPKEAFGWGVDFPNPHLPPAPVPISLACEIRYFAPLELGGIEFFHRWEDLRTYKPGERDALRALERSDLIKQRTWGERGVWPGLSKQKEAFLALFGMCSTMWIKSIHGVLAMSTKLGKRRMDALQHDECMEEIYRQRETRAVAREEMERMHAESVRSSKLRRIRAKKLDINSMQIINAATTLKAYASNKN